MARKRNRYTGVALLYVLQNGGRMAYRDLVNLLSQHVPDEVGYEKRISKLRLNPSETRAETIAKGKTIYAREAIAALFHQGRLTHEGRGTDRDVLLGRPPDILSQERFSDDIYTTDWDRYQRRLETHFDCYIHPIHHEIEDSEREE